MKTRFNNGLGIFSLIVVMAITPLVPAAVSAPTPHWVWDENGKVHDANGFYRTMTEEEACQQLGFCKKLHLELASSSSGASGTGPGAGGEGGDSGGCR